MIGNALPLSHFNYCCLYFQAFGHAGDTEVKWVLILVVALVVLFFTAGAMLSIASHEGTPPGLLSGRLRGCPDTPNCVCSECSQQEAFVLPLSCAGNPDKSWRLMQQAVRDLGGKISRVQDGYLAATFQTPLFRFVDDVELRLDRPAGVIQIRSASRVGRSDLGTNRKRVEAIRKRFNELAAR